MELVESRFDPSEPIETLLDRQLPALRAYVRLRCGPMVRARESTSDLVQSVCLDLLRDRNRFEFRGEAALRQWLFRAAERKIIDRARHWRHVGRHEARPATGSGSRADAQVYEAYATIMTPSRAAAANEQIARLETAFDALSADYRDVITSVRVLGLSYAEIAQETGQTEGAVRTQLCRALARLSQIMNGAPR